MKKLISLILAVALVFSLTACGTTDKKAETFADELGSKNLIRVGISPDYPPYESYNEKGEIVGFDVELANHLGKFLSEKSGEEYKIEFVPLDFMTIISALNAGTIDLGVSCFSYDPERDVLFSDTYLTSSQAIMVAVDGGVKAQADLKDKTIAATEATTGADVAKEMAASLGGNTKAIEGNIDVLTESLKAGAIAAIIAERPVMEAYAKANDKLTVLDDVLTDEQTKVIIKNGNEQLLAAVNEGIADFNAKTDYKDLVVKYFG